MIDDESKRMLVSWAISFGIGLILVASFALILFGLGNV